MLAALEAAGITVASVTMARPSLDEVYLRHAGRSFREAEAVAVDEARDPPQLVHHAATSAALLCGSRGSSITLIQPMIWLLLFGALFKSVVEIPGFKGSYIEFLTPGVIVMTR